MAISVAWGTKVINVPKADLTLIQGSPEIRELDVDWFRLELKKLEDDEDGMPFADTHRHNTEVTLSGLTYARIIEIINGYTVEFEDGQYTINCVGANHNLADVKIVNQSSLIVNNAAGLITSAGIEATEYDNGVWIDPTSSFSGTLYPTGTAREPVNNLDDAKLIASVRGFVILYVIGNFVVGSTDDISGFDICAGNPLSSVITLTPGCTTANTAIRHCAIQGTANGKMLIYECFILDLAGLNGTVNRCGFMGTITLAGSETCHMVQCYDGFEGFGEPIINLGGSGRGLNMRDYQGGIRFENKSGSEDVSVGLNGGRLEIAANVTAGDIIVRGVGEISENLGTATVFTDGLVNSKLVSDTVWLANEATFIAKGLKNKKSLVKTGPLWQLIIYDDDDSTPILTKDLKDKDGNNITDLEAGVLAQELKTSV